MFGIIQIVSFILGSVNKGVPMKTERNILIAFLLNLGFSIFEFIGGIMCGSVAILSDAVHDIGDAVSIGISYFLETVSHKNPDNTYTFGYARYSVIGGLVTTSILILGSIFVIANAVLRIINPTPIQYNQMIFFAVVGVVVNALATYFTHEGGSINQKAVNLHMLEDLLGWILVLIGAIVMRFTDFALLDAIISIAVAVFILSNAVSNIKFAVEVLTEKAPAKISVDEIREKLSSVEEILDVHHIHIWSLDGENCYATMHIKAEGDFAHIKHHSKHLLADIGITHSTIEFETKDENCDEFECKTEHHHSHHAHHHHHHH